MANVAGVVLVNVVLLLLVAKLTTRLRKGRSFGAALALLVLYGALGVTGALILIARGSMYHGTSALVASQLALVAAWMHATWHCGRSWVSAGERKPSGGRGVSE